MSTPHPPGPGSSRGRRTGHDGHGHGTSPGRLRRWAHLAAHAARPHGHDLADQVDDALETDRVGGRALLVSLAGLGLTAALVHADPSGTEHHELTAGHRRTHEAAGTRLPGGSRRLG